jgi:hypothetical protein
MRAPASFTCFTPPSAELTQTGAKLTEYRVDSVTPIRGPSDVVLDARVAPRAELWRLEQPGALAVPDAPFIGATQHLVYTDAETRRDLVRVSSPEPGPGQGSGPVAVLIPIQKSAEWWNLAQDERQQYLAQPARTAHVAIGRRYADRIYRRLYHARYLPRSEWDFLTYFEFRREDRTAFLELLEALRDPGQNPEWAFVERELEIWMIRPR